MTMTMSTFENDTNLVNFENKQIIEWCDMNLLNMVYKSKSS